jgi:hypothetical protein
MWMGVERVSLAETSYSPESTIVTQISAFPRHGDGLPVIKLVDADSVRARFAVDRDRVQRIANAVASHGAEERKAQREGGSPRQWIGYCRHGIDGHISNMGSSRQWYPRKKVLTSSECGNSIGRNYVGKISDS